MANAAVPCGMGLRKISDESEVVAGIHVCSDIHVRASTRRSLCHEESMWEESGRRR